MGALPIALGVGAGAELRQPLGLAVVGGLVVSQVLTLFITPVLYLYMDRLQTGLKSLFRRNAAPRRPASAGHDACRVSLKADSASRRESAFGTAAPCAVLSKMHHTGAPLFA